MDETHERFYAFEDIIHIALYGSDEEREILVASMAHSMNEKLEHLEKTLKNYKEVKHK